MANYPPTPSFGGPFANQWPPPPAPYPAYQGERLPGAPPHHTSSNHPYMPPPQLDTTPQIPGLGGNSTVPLPPPAQFPPLYHNPNFPPPPSPYFSGVPPQQEIPARPQSQGSRPKDYNGESSKLPSRGVGQTHKEPRGLSAMNNDSSLSMERGTREEGELSDGELDREPSSSMDARLARDRKELNQGSSLSKSQNAFDDPETNSSACQAAHFPNFAHGRKDEPMGSNLEEISHKVGNEQNNGGIQDQPSIMDRDVHDISQNSVLSSGMKKSDLSQNFEGGSSFSGTRLPGLRAPSINRNDATGVSGNDESSTRSFDGKSPTQLRLMAQGALLGLVPHNVRYHELVNEGIEPNVLKRLYDEIGIKIASAPGEEAANDQAISPTRTTESTEEENYTPPEPPADVENKTSPSSRPISSPEYVPTMKPSVLAPDAPQTNGQEKAQLKTSDSAATEPISAPVSEKPLERKDVIARMLAARAKKPVPDQAVSEKVETGLGSDHQTQSSEKQNGVPSTQPVTATHVTEAHSAQSTEALVKEKNKAQTELARQRMEQLKKQGLSKSNRRVHTDSNSSSSPPPQSHPQKVDPEHPISESSSRTLAGSLHYPLPDRPPAPETGPQSRIPGLFMTSSDQAVGSKESSPAKTQAQASPISRPASKTQILPRKRPVASDFTDEPASAAKKPFHDAVKGAVSENRVVIDISEDESMYDANEDKMDLDGESDKKEKIPASRDQRNSEQFQDRSSAEVLSKTPTKTPSRQGTQTTPNSRNSHKGKDQVVLQQKQLEIEAMRKRIAEYEKRHKAKQIASRTESPSAQPCPVSSVPETLPASQEKLPSPENNGTEPVSAEPPSVSKQPETEVQPDLNLSTGQSTNLNFSISSPLRMRASLDPANLDEMRQKIRRRKEIESGLPLLEAELQKSEQRLAEFKKEEQKLLAEITKGKEGKRQLIAELENLGIETEGLTMEELQATKDSLAENENTDNLQDISAPIQSPHKPSADGEPSNIRKDIIPQAKDPHGVSPTKDTEGSLNLQDAPDETGKSTVYAEETNDGEISSSSSMDESMSSAPSVSGDTPIVTNSPVRNGESIPMVSENPSLSKEPSVAIAPDNPSVPPSDNSQSMSGISESAEGIPTSIQDQGFDITRENSVDSDTYEPPEPDATENFETAYSPSFSPASPRSVEAASATMPSLSGTQDDEPLTETNQDTNEGHKIHEEEVENKTQLGSNRHFTPYVSPLKQFNAFRYHPSYLDEVRDSYRSLTYSHDIDPNKFICPFEASGGVCKDNSCIYQHFRDMHLSDDKILVQMGSLREGKTAQEKEEYIAGLKKIISDMRRDKVKDFNTVATEIAAYRRRFLDDPSRILPL